MALKSAGVSVKRAFIFLDRDAVDLKSALLIIVGSFIKFLKILLDSFERSWHAKNLNYGWAFI